VLASDVARKLNSLEKLVNEVRSAKTELESTIAEHEKIKEEIKKHLPGEEESDKKSICEDLLRRLGEARKSIEVSYERMKEVKPRSISNNERLSSIIMELRNRLDDQSKRRTSSVDYVRELNDYDADMVKLIESLRREEIRCDEKFLERPENMEIYKKLEEIFPMLQIEPIRIPSMSENVKK